MLYPIRREYNTTAQRRGASRKFNLRFVLFFSFHERTSDNNPQRTDAVFHLPKNKQSKRGQSHLVTIGQKSHKV